METWEHALNNREDLQKYGNNRLILYALQLHEGLEDIDLVAAESLTDGSNDKKCDLVYCDPESGKIIISQGYWTSNTDRKEAPANKASDLNTACSWLFGRDYASMPSDLKSISEEIESRLEADEISTVEIWYVHNLKESVNVKRELERVKELADCLIRAKFPSINVDSVSAKEVGTGTLDSWYRGTKTPILVTDEFTFETTGGYTTEGTNWRAYSTSVPASWLRDLYIRFGKELFSANVRDYLGSRRSVKNINNNIKSTANTAPEMFWVLNNGVTAIVNDFEATSEDESGLLEIKGIAVVNGAQTTGALGSLPDADLSNAFVPARFVKCSEPRTVQDIIRCNNSQNKVEAADFRSNDAIQSRLRGEFSKLGSGVSYFGGRRGGAEDSIRRPRNLLPSYSAGQALAAFHGEPAIAYNQRSNIWQSDTLYSRFFNEQTSAKHILFSFTLLKASEAAKANLRNISTENRTLAQSRQWETLQQRGATFLLTSALAASMETFLGRAIVNTFELEFIAHESIDECIEIWKPILDISLPFINALSGALNRSNLSKNRELVSDNINQFVDLIQAVSGPNKLTFSEFANRVC